MSSPFSSTALCLFGGGGLSAPMASMSGTEISPTATGSHLLDVYRRQMASQQIAPQHPCKAVPQQSAQTGNKLATQRRLGHTLGAEDGALLERL